MVLCSMLSCHLIADLSTEVKTSEMYQAQETNLMFTMILAVLSIICSFWHYSGNSFSRQPFVHTQLSFCVVLVLMTRPHLSLVMSTGN